MVEDALKKLPSASSLMAWKERKDRGMAKKKAAEAAKLATGPIVVASSAAAATSTRANIVPGSSAPILLAPATPRHSISVAMQGPARIRKCSHCKADIEQNTVKVVIETRHGAMPAVTRIFHLSCLQHAGINVEISTSSIAGFQNLPAKEQAGVISALKPRGLA